MYSDLKERIMPFLRETDDIYSGSNQKIITILDEYEEKMRGAISWNADDMIHQAAQEGWQLSDDDAQAALEEMINDHDANYGITWDTVHYHINKYKG
jgi:hypothetical protein